MRLKDLLLRRPKNPNLILIDVDGTISPSQYKHTPADYLHNPWHGGHYFPQSLKEALQGLPGEKVWLTAWGLEAEETFSCGWKTLRSDEQGGYWKLELAKAYLQKHPFVERIVWFDDELPTWAYRLEELSPVKVLPIAPDGHRGLGPDELLRAQEFLLYKGFED